MVANVYTIDERDIVAVSSSKALGARLRDARKARGWTQSDLAERIDASRHWVMDMERGKSTVEVGKVLRAVAALGLEIEFRTTTAPDSHTTRPPGTDDRRESGPLSSPFPLIHLEQVLARANGSRLDLTAPSGGTA